MKFFSFSLRSKHAMPPVEPATSKGVKNLESVDQTPLVVGEFGELSWYSTLPLEESYDGGTFFHAANDCHSHDDTPVLNGTRATVNSTCAHPVGASSISTQATAIFPPPGLSTVTGSRRPDREGGTNPLSQPPSYSSIPASKGTHESSTLRGPAVELSPDTGCFPLVPPTSDEMIDALTLGLERDYRRALVRQNSSSSTSSSDTDASSSCSDLSESRTSQLAVDFAQQFAFLNYLPGQDAQTESGLCASPDSDCASLPEVEGKATVRLVSSGKSNAFDLLPVLKKWDGASKAGGWWEPTSLRETIVEEWGKEYACSGQEQREGGLVMV